jgi:hypothetical protein
VRGRRATDNGQRTTSGRWLERGASADSPTGHPAWPRETRSEHDLPSADRVDSLSLDERNDDRTDSAGDGVGCVITDFRLFHRKTKRDRSRSQRRTPPRLCAGHNGRSRRRHRHVRARTVWQWPRVRPRGDRTGAHTPGPGRLVAVGAGVGGVCAIPTAEPISPMTTKTVFGPVAGRGVAERGRDRHRPTESRNASSRFTVSNAF